MAMLLGLSYLGLGAGFFYDCFPPERQSPDEHFGILFVPVLMAVGLWWCVYLNLPHVRAPMKRVRGSLNL